MLLIISLALAADREIGFGVTTLPNTDGLGSALGFGPQNGMVELSGGLPVHPNFAVTAAVMHGSTSQSIGSSADTFSSDIQTRTWNTGVKLGVKASLDVAPWFAPYVSVQGVGLHGYLRLDDDPGVDDNLTQVDANGFSGGVTGAFGSTFRIKLTSATQLGLSGDIGYMWLAPESLGEVAIVKVDGVTGRLAASLIF